MIAPVRATSKMISEKLLMCGTLVIVSSLLGDFSIILRQQLNLHVSHRPAVQHVILAVLELPNTTVPEILNVLASHDPALVFDRSNSTEDDVDLAVTPASRRNDLQL